MPLVKALLSCCTYMCGSEPFFELSPPLSLPKQAPLVLELAPRGARQHILQVGQEEDVQGVREDRSKGKEEENQDRKRPGKEEGSKDKKTRKYYFFWALSREGEKKRGRRLFFAALVFFPRSHATSSLISVGEKRSNMIRKRHTEFGSWRKAAIDGIGEGGRELAGGRCQN